MERTVLPTAKAFVGGGVVAKALGLVLPSSPTADAFPLIVKYTRLFDIPWDGIRMYEDHNAGIKRLVPKDRLLEYNVKDGWGPLCRFLGHPLPEHKLFPKVNSEDDYVRGLEQYQQHMLKVAMRRLSLVLLPLIALVGGVLIARFSWR